MYAQIMENASVQIRLATIDDLPDVQACARAAYAMYIERMDRVPAPMVADFAPQIELAQVYTVHCKSIFAGYVVFYPEADHLQVENVAVVPSYTGQGIGRKMLEYVEQTARDTGFQAVELYTNEAMTENLLMYPRLGYIETERKRKAGLSRVFFRKPI
jgi:GNAT superfamily N-acetyltransferase